jgi:hypothetical protein
MLKYSTLIVLLLFCSTISQAHTNDSIPAKKEDVQSVDAIINALYDVVSGAKGVKRNWDRMRTLFHPNASLIPTGKIRDSVNFCRYISVEDYIAVIGINLEKTGFFEKEINRKTEIFGDIVQVWSSYASRYNAADATPFLRGINGIQLWYDGKRWWIMNLLWHNETATNKLP